ncbi:MAG: flavodoxin [Moraxellaceae bacterium]|nr:MAG: flavodoxin [Moraxellaceae bacterium]
MAAIQILVGSVFGTAEEVAEAAALKLRELGHEVSINLNSAPADLIRNSDEILLLCHSNTGSGDLPDNILPIYLHITRDYPRIAGRRYGVINLGDSSYRSFNEAGRMLDAAFADLGAVRVGEPLVIDACIGDDGEAMVADWITDWVKLL